MRDADEWASRGGRVEDANSSRMRFIDDVHAPKEQEDARARARAEDSGSHARMSTASRRRRLGILGMDARVSATARQSGREAECRSGRSSSDPPL